MARKKDKRPREEPKPSYGWAAEEAAEEKLAEGLKRSDLDERKVTIVDRDLSTPVIETYDADTGELEGSIEGDTFTKGTPRPTVTPVASGTTTREREIVKVLVICPYCGGKTEQGYPKCQKCGADI